MSATIKLRGEPWVELLAQVFRDVPHLPGALCVGKHDLFGHLDSHYEAARICRLCPARAACREWADRHKHLTGTWAGTYRNHSSDTAEIEGVNCQ
ncbi:WhiB family transcriptional regulator [Mycolicibacterium elephantis]